MLISKSVKVSLHFGHVTLDFISHLQWKLEAYSHKRMFEHENSTSSPNKLTDFVLMSGGSH